MKKRALLSAALALCAAMCGCENTELPVSAPVESVEHAESVDVYNVDSIEDDSPNTEEDDNSEPTEPKYLTLDEDIPEEIFGIHDNSTGNYIYNPNVTDTSNTRRYYGDFTFKNDPKVLWTNAIEEPPWGDYDADSAVSYGKANWNNGIGLCAEFISRCLTTGGGITEFTQSSTAITLMLMHSGLGFGQFLPYNKDDHTITLPSYAQPGDVVQLYCSYEGVEMHSTMFVGTDENGNMRAVAHNLRNSGENTFYVDYLNDPCWCCKSETAEVFFYHFYRDNDEGLPAEVVENPNVVLWEEKAYTLPDERYDREAALEYAKANPEDGLGANGAYHTWKILEAGGCSAGYPNQSALFLQLLKTHLGSAESLKIRADRTVLLPDYAEAGDMCFVYCPEDGMIISSFIVSDIDEYGRMITESYDLLNDGTSAFKVDSYCAGCGEELVEVILYHF